jgi:hypothetical protein
LVDLIATIRPVGIKINALTAKKAIKEVKVGKRGSIIIPAEIVRELASGLMTSLRFGNRNRE